jgi:hypothetical protein
MLFFFSFIFLIFSFLIGQYLTYDVLINPFTLQIVIVLLILILKDIIFIVHKHIRSGLSLFEFDSFNN